MPKKLPSDSAVPTAAYGVAPLRSWQIAALSIAACGSAVHAGVGVIIAVPLLATVIWALARLHRRAPSAPSTSALIGSTLSVRAAGTAAMVQLVAYALLAVGLARAVGLAGLAGQPDIEALGSSWWWPTWSVAALMIAGMLVWSVPTRVVATLVAVLAAAGVLVYFFVSLAVLAKVLSGTERVPIEATEWTWGLAGGTTIIFLGLAAVGFEIPTTAADRLPSVATPLGWALGTVSAVAGFLLLATNLGAMGGFRLDTTYLDLIVLNMFGDSSAVLLSAGGFALGAAALLAVTWAVLRIARRLTGESTVTTVAVLALLAILTVVLCRHWGGASEKVLSVPVILLVVLYVFVAEANSRLPGAESATRTIRVLWLVMLAAVVLLPLRDAEFAAASLWPVAITAVVVGIGAALSAGAAQQGPQARRPARRGYPTGRSARRRTNPRHR
jgi:hypothetical protein